MFSAHDADLVRRDATLPGLATLLDGAAFLALLRRLAPRLEVSAADATYLRYKPAVSCLAGFRVTVGDAAVDVHARACGPASFGKIAKALHEQPVSGPFGQGIFIVEPLGLIVTVFPNDARLGSLARLGEPELRSRLIRRIAKKRSELAECAWRPISYRPERRFVAALVAGDEVRAAVKFYTESDYVVSLANAKAFQSGELLRVPSLIRNIERHRLLAVNWLPGRILPEMLADPQLNLDTIADVGRALHEFHSQPVEHLKCFSRESIAAAVAAVADTVGFLDPHWVPRAADLARRLGQALTSLPAARAPIHGDFYASQILVDGQKIGLLDFDEAAQGDPAVDLGNFIAHMQLGALRGLFPAARVEPVAEALVAGYQSAGNSAAADRVPLYIAVGLMRLALHPFRRREESWDLKTTAVLDAIEGLLAAGASPRVVTPVWPDRPVEVVDPFDVAADPSMPLLRHALDPREAAQKLFYAGAGAAESLRFMNLRAIRVTRYKPQRRCLIEYDCEATSPNGSIEPVTVIGKVRAKGLDRNCVRLLTTLRERGFGTGAADGVMVPEPVGVIPEFQMWLQRKAPGDVAAKLLEGSDGAALGRRIAQAVHKLHRTPVATLRKHTAADELRILRDRLSLLTSLQPQCVARVERLLCGCEHLASGLPSPTECGIHRDFYPDQILVNGSELYLLDFDLYCTGPSAVDVGNYSGHLIELATRPGHDPQALSLHRQAFVEHYLELAGDSHRAEIEVYTTLTLARHLYIATQFADRLPYWEKLWEVCEQRLAR